MAEENGPSLDSKRQLLRHMLATLAYRGGKALSNAPEGFTSTRVHESTRTPGEILSHICDLMDWAFWLSQGKHVWNNSKTGEWRKDVDRFFAAIERLDSYLASDAPLGCAPERLFQGAIADAFTHVGQISLLRRMAGAPVRGENYYKADIAIGRVGREQSAPRVEFD
jgi:hypothetical protein